MLKSKINLVSSEETLSDHSSEACLKTVSSWFNNFKPKITKSLGVGLTPVFISGDPSQTGFSTLTWRESLESHLPLPLLLKTKNVDILSSFITKRESSFSKEESSPSLDGWTTTALEKSQTTEILPPKLLAARVRLKPTKEQRDKLKEWFGAARWTYNKAIEKLNGGDFKGQNGKLSFIVRNSVVTLKGNQTTLPDWISKVPKEIRKSGSDEAAIAWKNKLKLQKEKNKKAEISFRKKKLKHQCFSLPKESVSLVKEKQDVLLIYPNSGLGQVKCNEKMLKKVLKKPGTTLKNSKATRTHLAHDAKISFNGTYYYIHIPYETSQTISSKNNSLTIGLDPGVRSFLTGYSGNGQTIDYITRRERIHSLRAKIANAKSKKQKYKFENRLTEEIRSTHTSVAKDLTSKFDNIILGKFDSQKLTEKKGSCLSQKSRIEIGVLSHFKFRDRLWLEARKAGCKIGLIQEHYTSKTCGGCGKIKNDLGASKVFDCKDCGTIIDRDVNAARNMIIKFLVASKV